MQYRNQNSTCQYSAIFLSDSAERLFHLDLIYLTADLFTGLLHYRHEQIRVRSHLFTYIRQCVPIAGTVRSNDADGKRTLKKQ